MNFAVLRLITEMSSQCRFSHLMQKKTSHNVEEVVPKIYAKNGFKKLHRWVLIVSGTLISTTSGSHN